MAAPCPGPRKPTWRVNPSRGQCSEPEAFQKTAPRSLPCGHPSRRTPRTARRSSRPHHTRRPCSRRNSTAGSRPPVRSNPARRDHRHHPLECRECGILRVHPVAHVLHRKESARRHDVHFTQTGRACGTDIIVGVDPRPDDPDRRPGRESSREPAGRHERRNLAPRFTSIIGQVPVVYFTIFSLFGSSI